MSPVEYSVVVPTVGERGTLRACLQRILDQSRPAAEVVVVAVEGVDVEAPSGVRVVHASASTSGQRNAGARAASAPVVLFVDDDVMLEPDFADAMLGVWERAGVESVAGVMGTVTNDPWEMRRSRRLLRAALGQSHVALFGRATRVMASGNVAFVPFPDPDRDVGFAGTACVSYRRDLLMDEPFDERFGGYVLGEDLDLSARLARRGRLIHTVSARCRHEPVALGLGSDASSAYLRGRAFALYRGYHRRPGMLGRLAWEWANAAEAAILLVRARGRPARAAAFLAGLREARAELRRRPKS